MAHNLNTVMKQVMNHVEKKSADYTTSVAQQSQIATLARNHCAFQPATTSKPADREPTTEEIACHNIHDDLKIMKSRVTFFKHSRKTIIFRRVMLLSKKLRRPSGQLETSLIVF